MARLMLPAARTAWRKSRLDRWINARVLLQVAVVLGVLALSYKLGKGAGKRDLLLVGGALGAFAVAQVYWRKPGWVLLLLLPAALIVPFQLGTGTGSALNAAILLTGGLAALWLGDMFVRRREVRFVRAGPLLPLLLLSVIAVVAFINGQLPWFPVGGASLPSQMGGLFMYLMGAAAFLLAAHLIGDAHTLRQMVWIFLAIGAVYIAGRILPGPGEQLTRVLPTGAYGSVFWVWLVALPFSLALIDRELTPVRRLALLGLALATLAVALGPDYEWKSGWMPAAAALATVLWVQVPRLRLWMLVTAFVVSIPYIKDIFDFLLRSESYSWDTRLAAWQIVLQIARVNPLLGLGPSNYYFYTPLFPILGWQVSFNSHSQYVDLIAQTGVLGLACFLWFMGAMALFAWRLRNAAAMGSFTRAYATAAIGGIVGMLVAGVLGDWVIPFVYNIGLAGFRSAILGWLFLGGVVALAGIGESSGAKATSEAR